MKKSRPIQKKKVEKKTEDMDDEKKRIQKYLQPGYHLMQNIWPLMISFKIIINLKFTNPKMGNK